MWSKKRALIQFLVLGQSKPRSLPPCLVGLGLTLKQDIFLKEDVLPKNKSEADKVRRKAHWFWLSEDQKLYKRSFFGPYLLCIHPEVVELLLEELH